MKVWVVGRSGMLGTCMAAELARRGVATVSTTSADLDVTGAGRVAEFARGNEVTHIINCSAYTQVDQAEQERERAFAVNEAGPRNLAEAATAIGAAIVHVSTDYVFDGGADEPYTEQSTPRPLGVYGESKLAGEAAVAEAVGGFDAPRIPAYVVRTSWLFGPGNQNFVRRMFELVQERSELRVVSDQRGRPTYAPDLAAALMRLCGIEGAGAPAGLYHFANTGITTWHGLADRTRRLAADRLGELRCAEIAAIPTSEYPTPAARPAYSVLSTDKVTTALGTAPRPWEAALEDYVDYLVTRKAQAS